LLDCFLRADDADDIITPPRLLKAKGKDHTVLHSLFVKQTCTERKNRTTMTRKLFMGLLITAFITNATSFVLPKNLHNQGISLQNAHKISLVSLNAKKKKQKSGGKGFGKQAPVVGNASTEPAPMNMEASSPTSMTAETDGSFLTSVAGGSGAVPTVDESVPVEDRTSAILRDAYGLRTREEQREAYKKEQTAKEQRKKLDEWKKLADKGEDFDLMKSLPGPVLIGIDRFLKVGVAICTVLFVLAGIGITIEAWSKASASPLPEDIDNFIVNVIEPNFTPGLGVLLGFSISLGAFATAQLASASATYREDN
jgi:hypothetical protein